MNLQLSKNLTLPVEAVTQTIAVLAKRRAGKSYTARRFAEQLFVLTEAGRRLANYPDQVLDTAELQRRVLDRLPGPERRILQVILDRYPAWIGNDECATAAGYTPGGGAFNNPRGRLRTLGLIEYQSGALRARALLFLEGGKAARG